MTTGNSTPKTLKEAIQNGLSSDEKLYSGNLRSDVIERHVRDFLAQRFGAYMLSESIEVAVTTQNLFNDIIGKKGP